MQCLIQPQYNIRTLSKHDFSNIDMLHFSNILSFAYHELTTTLKEYSSTEISKQFWARRQEIINQSACLWINMKHNIMKLLLVLLAVRENFSFYDILKPKNLSRLIVIKFLFILYEQKSFARTPIW